MANFPLSFFCRSKIHINCCDISIIFVDKICESTGRRVHVQSVQKIGCFGWPHGVGSEDPIIPCLESQSMMDVVDMKASGSIMAAIRCSIIILSA